jgi:hypothetical protein
VRATADNPAVDMDAPRRVLELRWVRRVFERAEHVGRSSVPIPLTALIAAADDLLRATESRMKAPS